jgi:hypothetical protein
MASLFVNILHADVHVYLRYLVFMQITLENTV